MSEGLIDNKQEFGSYRGMVYAALVFVAVAALPLVIVGRLPFISYLGLITGLMFVGLFITNLKIFIVGYVGLRGLIDIFLEPTKIQIGGFSMQMIGILGAAILLGGLAYIIINGVKIYEVSVVGPMMVFMVATLPTTLIFSLDKIVGFKDWVGTASAVMLFILIATLFADKKSIELLLKALILSAIPPLVVGFYQQFTGTGDIRTEGFNRIYATFTHPNTYAFYLVILLLTCSTLLMEAKKNWLRITYGVLCGAMIVSLIFTYARMPWFSLLIGIGILALIRYRRLLLAGPVILAVVLIFVPSILGRFEEAFGFSEGQGSMFFRVEMWRYLLPKFYSSPIVGNGLGSFSNYAQTSLGYFYLPHNDYVRLLVDTGIIGLISYIASLYGLVRGAIRSYLYIEDEQLRILGLVLAVVVLVYVFGGLTENLFRAGTTQAYFWTLAGMVAAAARIFRVREDQGDAPEQLSFASMQVR